MSSILSAQNLQTLRRRNIGRRWPSLPCCPPCPVVLPRPPPPELFLPFIVPPRPCQTDRRLPSRRAALHPADDRVAARARRGAGARCPCACCARARQRTALRRCGRPGGG